MNDFRKDSYFTQPPRTVKAGEALEVGQTSMLPGEPPGPSPSLVRPTPTRRDLEDWSEELRGLALRASDARQSELEGDLDALEARIAVFL